MANISDSFLTDLSKSIGISYGLKKNVLGSQTKPNSALFNLLQISSILIHGKPIFGVYQSASSFSTVSYNSSLDLIYFSAGQVFYNRNLINVPSQNITVKGPSDVAGTKIIKYYLDYEDFNLLSTVFSATVSAVNTNIITVDQLPLKSYLNNFKQVNLNGYLIGVNYINSSTNEITLYEDVSSFTFEGTTVNLIFQPVIKTIESFAIEGTPADIDIPPTGIILAKAKIGIDTNLNYSLVGSTEKLFVSYPTYENPSSFFPNQASYNAFLTTVNNGIQAYNKVQTYDIESSLVNSYISYTQGLSTTRTTFDQYWHQQPYKPSGIFQYGIGYQGLQKVDFDKRFKDFWYFSKNKDLTRTLAIFRGDIYGGNAVVGQSLGAFPGTVTVRNYIDYSDTSTLYNGTFSYGVSGIKSSGEYTPLFASSANFYFNKKVNNYISWTSTTPISNLLFFHVYKNERTNIGFEQQRLTNPFSLTSYPLSDVLLNTTSGTLGVASSTFAFLIKTANNTSGFIGGLYFNAYLADNGPLTGIQSCLIVSSGSNYIHPVVVVSGVGTGAAISVSTSATGGISSVLVTSIGSGYSELPTLTIFDNYSNSGGNGAVLLPVLSKLNCGIFTGTSLRPLGTSIASLEPIDIASIPNVSTGINMGVSNTSYIGLSSNTWYWAVFTMRTQYALSSTQKIQFTKTSGFISSYATTNDNISWAQGINSSQIAKLGYLDRGYSGTVISSRGVLITEEEPAEPQRLRIFVPNLDLSSLIYDDVGNLLNNGIGTENNLPIQNSMNVYVLAENTATGVQSTLYGSVPRGTSRGTSILLGESSDLFDKIIDVFVEPNISQGVNYINNSTVINWTIFDMFTVDTSP